MRTVRGFTLIEILVVLVIISVLTGLVVVGIAGSDGSRAVEQESRRLALLIEMARDACQVRGEQWGLDVGTESYGFLRFDVEDRTWQSVQEAPFAKRQLPENVRVHVDLDRPRVLTLRRDPLNPALRNAVLPEVLIHASGEVSNFILEVTDTNERFVWRVFSDGLQAVGHERVSP